MTILKISNFIQKKEKENLFSNQNSNLTLILDIFLEFDACLLYEIIVTLSIVLS